MSAFFYEICKMDRFLQILDRFLHQSIATYILISMYKIFIQ